MLNVFYEQFVHDAFKSDADREAYWKKFHEQVPNSVGKLEVRVNLITNNTEVIIPLIFKDKEHTKIYGISAYKRYTVAADKVEEANNFLKAFEAVKEASKKEDIIFQIDERYNVPGENGTTNTLQLACYALAKGEKPTEKKLEDMLAYLTIGIPPKVI